MGKAVGGGGGEEGGGGRGGRGLGEAAPPPLLWSAFALFQRPKPKPSFRAVGVDACGVPDRSEGV